MAGAWKDTVDVYVGRKEKKIKPWTGEGGEDLEGEQLALDR